VQGLLWVNMDDDAMPLEHFLGVLPEKIAPYNLQRMVLVSHQTVELDANWKTVRDNFLEQYHVDFIHPQHADTVNCEGSANTLFPFGHSMTSVQGFVTDDKYTVPEEAPYYLAPLLSGLDLEIDSFKGRVPEIRKAVQQQKRKIAEHLGFDYGELSDDEITDVIQLDIFPNLFITIQAEEVSLYTPRPHQSDPDKCFFDKWTLQIPAELGSDPSKGWALSPALTTSRDDPRPQREVFDQHAIIDKTNTLSLTFDQDVYYLPHMQAGMHSRGFDKLTLNIDEVRIQHFHNWLDSYIR
jgi:phenylpropionate dioxygenase-like ring-hydroxylating dioxygenase large terminal subunit